jgi:lipid-A-disaccharide synthase-like uncharacterized protein
MDTTSNAVQRSMHQEPLQGVWAAMEKVPVGIYYFGMLGSTFAALGLYLSEKRDLAQLVGQWVPTFGLLALMNRMLRPSQQ